MSITRASEDAGDKTEYCSVQDVRVHLAGIGADVAGDPFAAFLGWDSGVVEQKISALLPVAKKEIDRYAQRDFCLHEEVDVVLDGTGTQYLEFYRWGFVPLVEVSALTVEGDVQDLGDFVIYEDGRFGSVTWFTDMLELSANSWTIFPVGRQNVEATITWGYTTVPADIMLASVYMVGYHLAILMDSMQDLNGQGMIHGVTSVRYGDMTIGVGGKGVYERLATRLKDAAVKICGGYYNPIVTAPRPEKAMMPIFPAGLRW